MGKLTESQIEKGQAVLKQIEDILEKKKVNKNQVDTLSGEFYTLIPTASSKRTKLPPLDTLEKVKEKEELLKFLLRMGFQKMDSD